MCPVWAQARTNFSWICCRRWPQVPSTSRWHRSAQSTKAQSRGRLRSGATHGLPVTHATSLAIAKFDQLDRNVILPELLKSLTATIDLWENGSDLPLEQYRQASSTMGKEVEVHLPSGEILKSQALGINEIGELELASGVLVNVGDVRHLR